MPFALPCRLASWSQRSTTSWRALAVIASSTSKRGSIRLNIELDDSNSSIFLTESISFIHTIASVLRGSYSARVPRSSLAEVDREFVHHIVEDEVDDQEERQDDRREDRQQGEESGEVKENQTHNMSAWRWRMRCEVRTPNLRLEPRVCLSFNEKMWRVRCAVHTPRRLQQIAISCKRSDYKKTCKVSLLSSLVKKPHNRSLRSIWCSFTGSEVLDLLWMLWAPPGIVPLPPWCAGWRRGRMPLLIQPGRNRCKSLFSRLTVKTV